jgi:hypothetical protein
MKDAKGHGSDARGGNGQFQTRTVGTGAQARIINATKERLERTDMPHHRGVDAATLGKKLG